MEFRLVTKETINTGGDHKNVLKSGSQKSRLKVLSLNEFLSRFYLLLNFFVLNNFGGQGISLCLSGRFDK